MNMQSPLLLIGIGTAGSAIARGINRAFGDELRYVFADTDAQTGINGEPFTLLGGDRFSGRGTGGDVVNGRLAAEDSIKILDEHLEGVRVAVIVTSLGGGTGGGATLVACKYLLERGIPTIVFATLPFGFEGEDRQRNAKSVMSMIEETANTVFFLPLDKLIGDVDNMDEAMRHAVDTVASAVTLFWRLIEKPGYIRMDVEQLRHLLVAAGRGRFAALTVQGQNRAKEAIDRLLRSELLALSSGPVRAALCGVLAGHDLLLSEVGTIAEGVKNNFACQEFKLATVNDESTFSGRLSVVVMLFESATKADSNPTPNVMSGRRRRNKAPLGVGPTGRGRFKNAEPTIWNGEDLDIPTFIRKSLNLDF